MAELPDEMLRRGRPIDEIFLPDEWLYRRVRPEEWDDNEVRLSTIELPDMSVNRGKYSIPEWARLHEDLANWGVMGFEVRHIPTPILDQGVFSYNFKAVHVPHARNYPHSEVQAFESIDGGEPQHLDGKIFAQKMSAEAHLRWRNLLRRKCRPILKPI